MASKEASFAIIEFDRNQYLKGIEHLGTLHNAIFYKRVLEVSYHPYERKCPLMLFFTLTSKAI
jgi:hypothetical protein